MATLSQQLGWRPDCPAQAGPEATAGLHARLIYITFSFSAPGLSDFV